MTTPATSRRSALTMTAPHGPDRAAPTAPTLSLGEKIDRVWKTMHPKDRAAFTYKEVSAGIEALGVTVSPSYLIQLRHGQRDNPTIRQLQAIASFFHVPMTYFFGTDAEVDTVDAQMALVRATRSPAVRDLALRASTLTPAGLRAIAHIVDELQSVQGMTTRRDRSRSLPEPQPPPGGDETAAEPTATAGADHAPDTQPGLPTPSDPPPPARPRKRRS